jgi:hypothetical protein
MVGIVLTQCAWTSPVAPDVWRDFWTLAYQAAADRLHANRIGMHLAPPADQCHDTGHLAALDIAGHDLVHAVEAPFG